MSRRTFTVDKSEAKLMGVCAGIGRMAGVDPTIVRIGFVVATLIGGWPWTVVAYLVLGIVGQPRRARSLSRGADRTTLTDHDGRSADYDRRMAEIDSYVAGSNSRLAREIEELR
jgi:phage shock protein C